MIVLKSSQEIELMRQAGRIAGEVLHELSLAVKPGITTASLDNLALRCIRKNNAEPAFLGYNGFPASICTSINEELVHGIPGLRQLKNGDIVSIDVGVLYKGYYGDAAATFPVGKVSPLAAQLIEVTRESLNQAVNKAVPGNRLYDISNADSLMLNQRVFQLYEIMLGMA